MLFNIMDKRECSLRRRIQINHLVQDQYIQMLINVSNGLMSIHSKNIIHRDIKPQNIIYSKGTFKITDFGISTQKEKTNEIVGTGLYWAPEILFNLEDQKQHNYTHAVDIWSFGVLAFQAYFLTHPFFYQKDAQKFNTLNKRIEQLKRNINALTPNFTFQKFIKHLRKNNCQQKASFIENKLKHTNQQLIQTFRSFFQLNPQKRQPIQMLLGLFESIQQFQLSEVQTKKSRYLIQDKIPADVSFFTQSLNMFYQLNKDYKYGKDQQVECILELGLRMLSLTSYKGKSFIAYYCKQKVMKYTNVHKDILQEIRSTLSQYYFYLRQSKEILFFPQLPILRIYICLCSCWHLISKKLNSFFLKVQQIMQMQCTSTDEFRQLLPALTEKQLASIENCILSYY